MIRFNKKIIAVSVLIFTLISVVSQTTFALDETKTAEKPRVEFVISEIDDDGFATASLMIYNATFAGGQFGFSFNKDVMQIVNKETKQPTEEFNEASTLFYLENENGTHKFTELDALNVASNQEGKLSFGFYGMPSGISDRKGAVTVGEEGFMLYQFIFKFFERKNPEFEILPYGSAVINKEAFLADGADTIPVVFRFVIPEELGETEDVDINLIEPEKSLKQKRAERLVDSLILNIGNYAAVDDGFLKWIDDDNKEVVPFIESDRTFVPVRFISEAFGAEVKWNPENQEILISLDETDIKMYIKKDAYTVNGEENQMDVAPFIKEDRTFVPIRFISEALGKSVYWDPGMKLIMVTPEDRPWDPDGEAEKNILPDALLIMSDLIRDIKPSESGK